MYLVCYVTPIFKEGDKSDIKNYRAISKTSLISKIFESIVADKITPLFKHLIMIEQHGFVRSRSTISNLLCYEQYLLEAFEMGYQVDSIYTDFSKAFDRVDHDILLRKLETMGVFGMLLDWFRSNITGRKQAIKIKNYVSSQIDVTSGVAQGGHLSAFLFNCFINDV